MKKVLAILLTLVMVIGLVPASALVSAEEGHASSCGNARSDARALPYVFGVYDAIQTLGKYTDVDKMEETLFDAFYQCKTSINMTSFGIPYTAENVEALRLFVFDYMPGVIHIDYYDYWWNGGLISRIEPAYAYTGETYRRMYNQVVAAKNKMISGIKGNSNLGDAEKALLLHDRLAMACEYDYNDGEHQYTTYGALVLGVAVCQGYAEAYGYLLREVGIESYLCSSEELDHAWNIVFVDGKPYHVDVTWDDWSWADGERGVVGVVEHNNFLRSSDGIYATGHWASDYNTFPTSTKYDYYFWRNSYTAFQLVGNEIYYVDNNSETLNRYSDRRVLYDLSDTWSGSDDHWSCLSSDNRDLYYSKSKAVYRYNIANGKSMEIYRPSLGAYESIYGFQYTNGYVICDINSWSAEDGWPYELRQVRQNVYMVSYSANGGSGAPGAQVKVPGTPLTLSTTIPTRSGYAFLGWATSPSATTVAYQPGAQFKNNANTTLYAVWQKGVYRVSFNGNGGSGVPNAQIKVPGTALKLSTTIPTRSGYAFLGWATSPSATTVAYHPGSQFKNNAHTTLYAVWQKDAYRVTFVGNGGSGVPNAQIKVKGTPLKLSTQVPTRSGYAFVGWATSASATTAAYQPGGQFKNNSPTTLYAVWQKDAYRVTFSGNGGSGVPNAQIKVKGTALKLSTQVPTRSGYAFLGWSTSSSATTATYQPGAQFKNNATTTLYAVWQKDAYRVTFAGNGGSGVPNAQIKVKGTPLKLSTQVPTRSGYAFVGWSTSSSATTAAYQPGGEFKNNSTTTLYAVWQKDAYRITFNANGGSGIPNAQIKVKGTPLTLSSTMPKRDGYAFVGWSTDKNATTATYQPNGQFKNNATTTLYAVWKKGVYRVSYDANGGSGAPDAQFKVPGTPLTLSTKKPTRSGYKFLGWATNKNATAGTYASGAQYKNNTTVTLYAVWKKNVPTLTAGGTHTANITSGGQEILFTFQPKTSGIYHIYSTGSDDTYVSLQDASGTTLKYNDDGGEGRNFSLEYTLQEGCTYQYVVRFYSSSKTGTISFRFEKV